jgi:hypothetical protein
VLIVLSYAVGYLVMAGVTTRVSSSDPEFPDVVLGALWPVFLPAITGYRLLDRMLGSRQPLLPPARVHKED